jgi:hypothetical protein
VAPVAAVACLSPGTDVMPRTGSLPWSRHLKSKSEQRQLAGGGPAGDLWRRGQRSKLLQRWAGPGHSPVPRPGGAGLLLCANEGEKDPDLKLIGSGSRYRRRLLDTEATPEQ